MAVGLIRQQMETQNNKYNICKNIKRVDHECKVRYKVIINNNAVYKYEIPYKGPFLIVQCCTNGMVELQYGAIKNQIPTIDAPVCIRLFTFCPSFNSKAEVYN